jgi:hypothetical protein
MNTDLLIRCSSLGKIMTEPKSKSEGPLSKGAKTYIRELAAQAIFGVDFEISSKQIEKGLRMEAEAIALLNRVRGLSLAKNTERRTDGFLTGECDLFDASARRGHDMKCSWSIATFPIVTEACIDKDYEWQMRGYQRLWDAQEWEVNYALLDTPEDLIGFESQSLHFVRHYPEHMRLTTWTVTRDRAIDEQIDAKVRAAREYMAQVIREFDVQHRQGRPAPVIDDMTPPWDRPESVPAAVLHSIQPAAQQPLRSSLF